MKYRKKPVVIEAVKWYGKYTDTDEWPEWFNDAVNSGVITAGSEVGTLTIGTLEGNHTASIDDYIIQGIKGELYPCKPDIFEATYEAIELNALELGAAVRAMGL